MDTKDILCGNLLTIRSLVKYSQEEMADLLSVKRATYNNYEKGITVPSAIFVLDFGKKFGFTSEQLCGTVIPGDEITAARISAHLLKSSRKVKSTAG